MYLTRNSALGILALVVFFAIALAQFAHADAQDEGSADGSRTYGHHNGMTANSNGGWVFETHMTGSEEVPPRSTDTTGDGGVWFGADGAGMRTWAIVWQGDEITKAHLHCGDPGENGPPVVTLYDNSNGADVNGILAQKTVSDSSIMDADCESVIGYNIDSVHDLAHAIENGDIYMNVHNEQYPDGVIRGQFEGREMPGGGGSSDDGKRDDKDDKKHHDGDRKDHDGHNYGDDENGKGGDRDGYGTDDGDHHYGNTDHDDNRNDDSDHDDYDRHDNDHRDGHDGNDGRDGKDGRDGHDSDSHNYHSSSHVSSGNGHASARSYTSINAHSSVRIHD